MPGWFAPFLGSMAVSALSGGINALTGERAHKRDRQEALEDWNRQNEYNSPKNQMQRYKDAGLNPQLIYGQGTPGNASATPVQTQKSGNPTHRMDLQAIYGEAKRLEANMQQVHQTVENLKTNQELMQTNIQLQNQLKEQREKEFPFKLDKIDASIYALNSSSDWKNKMLYPTVDALNTRTSIAKQKNDREERWLGSQLNMNATRSQQIRAQTALTMQMRAKAVQETINKTIQNEYQREYLKEGLSKLIAETENIIQGRRTSISIEELNKINAELREYDLMYKPADKTVSLLEKILSPLKKR